MQRNGENENQRHKENREKRTRETKNMRKRELFGRYLKEEASSKAGQAKVESEK